MSCGCGDVTKISVGFCMNDIMQDESIRKTLSEIKMISKQGFHQGKVLPILQYAACMDWPQFRGMLANFGIDVQLNQLPVLAQVIESGGDKAGQIDGRTGQPVYIDIMAEVRKMRFTAEQVQQSQCSIVFT